MNAVNTDLRQRNETGAIVPVPILSVAERAALLECEGIIRQGRAVFVHVGQALSRIRDSRLYRERYSTFEEYCLAEWEISDRFARNLRSASDVVHVLEEKKFAALPATESQARPITKLPREEWAPAWEEVLGTAPNGRITASHVAAVVQDRLERLSGNRPLAADTEVLQRPSPGGRQLIDAGTREERIQAAYASALAKLRELQDLVPAGDGGAAHICGAVNCIDSFQQHFHTVRRLKRNVEQSQGLNPDHAKRVQEMQSTRKAAA